MTYQLKRVFDHVKHLTAENTKLIAMFKSAGGKHNNTFGAEDKTVTMPKMTMSKNMILWDTVGPMGSNLSGEIGVIHVNP